MTPKKPVDPEGEDSLGVLDDTASSDTTGVGLLGGTAQVNVSLPTNDEDDDLVDDEIVDGESISDLLIDTSAVADDELLARMRQVAPEIVIELPAEELPAAAAAEPETGVSEAEIVAELVVDPEPVATDTEVAAVEISETDAVAPAGTEPDAVASGSIDTDDVGAERVAERTARTDMTGPAAATEQESVSTASHDVASKSGESAASVGSVPSDAVTKKAVSRNAAGKNGAGKDSLTHKATTGQSSASKHQAPKGATAEDAPSAGAVLEDVSTDSARRSAASDDAAAAVQKPSIDDVAPIDFESVVAAAKAELREAMSPNRPQTQYETRPRTANSVEENRPVATNDRVPAARPASETPRPASDVALTSKRLDDLSSSGRESADLLTADRLLDPSRVMKPEPEGTWSHLLYAISGGHINIGDGRKARDRKELSRRIASPMTGTARFVPVLSRKGGVGKTTVTALLGMALADARDDRVIAIDANPDRGTLAERIVGSHAKSVRDMVRAQHDIRGFHDISALVARDHTRLDVLASDSDPRVSEAFGDADYRDVATVAAQYYSMVLTDSGTGIVHAVMGATLDLADQLVIVSGLSVDEARLASETITWLETNGYAELARESIVVLNQSTPGAPLVRLSELESHFSTRAKHVLRIPYDSQIAGGGAIDFGSLQAETRRAAREIAATLVEGLRAKVD